MIGVPITPGITGGLMIDFWTWQEPPADASSGFYHLALLVMVCPCDNLY
jgi:hypothetical protein